MCGRRTPVIRTALKKQDAAEKLLTASKSAFDAVLESYKQGLSTYTEVVTAERNLTRCACDQSRHAGSNLHHSSGARTERRRSCPPGATTRQEATKMKTEFARVAPSSSNNPPRVRRDRSRPVVLVGLLLLIGALVFVVRPVSHRSPTIDILGSYFPAWMICIVSGLTLTLVAALDCASVPSEAISRSGAAHLFMPDDHLHVCDLDPFLSKLKHAMLTSKLRSLRRQNPSQASS